MFPTQVGMNRVEDGKHLDRDNVPHAGGDEPREAQQRASLP